MCWAARGGGALTPAARADRAPPLPAAPRHQARPGPLDHDEGEGDQGRGLWTSSEHCGPRSSYGAPCGVPAPCGHGPLTQHGPCPPSHQAAACASYSSNTTTTTSTTSPCSPAPRPAAPQRADHAALGPPCAGWGGVRTCRGWWRALLRWPLSLQVLLLTLAYSGPVAADDQLSLIHARLVNMLKTKQSLFYRRHLRADPGLDLREHRLFHSDPRLDCCPTLTEFEPRRTGINPGGMVLELFSNKNFTQSFYETICHPSLRNRPCQFIDPRISSATRCVQQFSYVYAIGRTYGSHETFRVDYIRIPSGCKCQVKQNLLRRRKKKSAPSGVGGLLGARVVVQ